MSAKKRKARRRRNAVIGAGATALVARALGASRDVTVALGLAGAYVGYDLEPDPQKGKRRR